MELNYNRVELRGVAEDAPLLSHVNHGCAFYRFTLSVLRLSGQADKLPVIVSRPRLLLTPVSPGDGVHITGQLRSFNNKSGQGSRLVISTFAQTLTHDAGEPLNRIFLSGVLCKQPALRRTPLGREICDMILAVNRRYGRADYLPCRVRVRRVPLVSGGDCSRCRVSDPSPFIDVLDAVLRAIVR